MELTGKCKEDFEVYLLNWIKENVAWECETPTQEDVDHFYKFPFTMQWGVYLEFFDTFEMYLHTERAFIGLTTKGYKSVIREVWNRGYETRSEAQKEAIKKANELYNLNT